MRMPSVMSVPPPISRKLGLALVLHHSGDLVPRVSLDSSCNAALRAWMFLSASIMRRILCPKTSFSCSNLDMSDKCTGQSMRT